YFLPNTATGERETIVTSTLNAEPQYLQRMPAPSAWHVWAAVFTAAFFLLLTVQAYWPGVICGVLAIYCILHWCWFLDRPRIEPTVDVGAGVRLPTYASGPSSHGWWAMVITLIVAGMVGTLLGFSYVFLWSRQPESWTPPPDLPLLFPVIGAYAAAAALAWGSCRTLRLDRRRTPAL